MVTLQVSILFLGHLQACVIDQYEFILCLYEFLYYKIHFNLNVVQILLKLDIKRIKIQIKIKIKMAIKVFITNIISLI
jgi:hypothetical protein